MNRWVSLFELVLILTCVSAVADEDKLREAQAAHPIVIHSEKLPAKLGSFATGDLLRALQIIDLPESENGEPVASYLNPNDRVGTHPVLICVEKVAAPGKNRRLYFVGLSVADRVGNFVQPNQFQFRKVDIDAQGNRVEEAVFSLVIPDAQMKFVNHPTLSLTEISVKESAKSYAIFYQAGSAANVETVVDVHFGMDDVDSCHKGEKCSSANYLCHTPYLLTKN